MSRKKQGASKDLSAANSLDRNLRVAMSGTLVDTARKEEIFHLVVLAQLAGKPRHPRPEWLEKNRREIGDKLATLLLPPLTGDEPFAELAEPMRAAT